MNIQTKLRLDRLTVYLERVKTALDRDNFPAAMADVAELSEQARRCYNFLVELNRNRQDANDRCPQTNESSR